MFAVVLAVVLAVTFQTAQSSCVSKLTATANLDSKTRNLEVLDMSCGAGEYFHGFRLSWGPGMYTYKCCTFDSGILMADICEARNTAWSDEGSGNPIYLDRHNVECSGADEYLKRVKYDYDATSAKGRYDYTCCRLPAKYTQTSSCASDLHTGWNEHASNAIFLDRHNVDCDADDQYLKKMHLNTDGGNVRYAYKCCSLVAPPAPTPVPSAVADVGWVGCYAGLTGLDAGPQAYGYTAAKCRAACSTFRYSGLEDNGRCICGNKVENGNIASKVSDSACGLECFGEEYLTPPRYCGANYTTAVYSAAAVVAAANTAPAVKTDLTLSFYTPSSGPDTSNTRSPQYGDARLSAYPLGRVEIYYLDEWGTVCGTTWDDNDHGANNTCQSLGYLEGAAIANPGSETAPTPTPIIAGNRKCIGGERTIYDCPMVGTSELDGCSRTDDQWVSCQGRTGGGDRVCGGTIRETSYTSASSASALATLSTATVDDCKDLCRVRNDCYFFNWVEDGACALLGSGDWVMGSSSGKHSGACFDKWPSTYKVKQMIVSMPAGWTESEDEAVRVLAVLPKGGPVIATWDPELRQIWMLLSSSIAVDTAVELKVTGLVAPASARPVGAATVSLLDTDGASLPNNEIALDVSPLAASAFPSAATSKLVVEDNRANQESTACFELTLGGALPKGGSLTVKLAAEWSMGSGATPGVEVYEIREGKGSYCTLPPAWSGQSPVKHTDAFSASYDSSTRTVTLTVTGEVGLKEGADIGVKIARVRTPPYATPALTSNDHEVATYGPSACNETKSGDGSDYRGCQTQSTSGKTCQRWNAMTPHAHTRTEPNWPNKGLTDGNGNYCRNVDGSLDIWCYTTDPGERWEYCDPLPSLSAINGPMVLPSDDVAAGTLASPVITLVPNTAGQRSAAMYLTFTTAGELDPSGLALELTLPDEAFSIQKVTVFASSTVADVATVFVDSNSTDTTYAHGSFAAAATWTTTGVTVSSIPTTKKFKAGSKLYVSFANYKSPLWARNTFPAGTVKVLYSGKLAESGAITFSATLAGDLSQIDATSTISTKPWGWSVEDSTILATSKATLRFRTAGTVPMNGGGFQLTLPCGTGWSISATPTVSLVGYTAVSTGGTSVYSGVYLTTPTYDSSTCQLEFTLAKTDSSADIYGLLGDKEVIVEVSSVTAPASATAATTASLVSYSGKYLTNFFQTGTDYLDQIVDGPSNIQVAEVSGLVSTTASSNEVVKSSLNMGDCSTAGAFDAQAKENLQKSIAASLNILDHTLIEIKGTSGCDTSTDGRRLSTTAFTVDFEIAIPSDTAAAAPDVSTISTALSGGDFLTSLSNEYNKAQSESGSTALLDSSKISVPKVEKLTATSSAASSFTAESGRNANTVIKLALSREPTSDVTVKVSSSNTKEAIVEPKQLVFTQAEWNTAEYDVNVLGQNDNVVDGDQAYAVTVTFESDDQRYTYTNDFQFVNRDDDSYGLDIQFVDVADKSTTEMSGTCKVRVKLTSQPSGAVVLIAGISNPSEAIVSPALFVLGSDTWDTGVELLVTGISDGLADGDTTYLIQTTVAIARSDPEFEKLPPGFLTLTNKDEPLNKLKFKLLSTEPCVTAESDSTMSKYQYFNVALESWPLEPGDKIYFGTRAIPGKVYQEGSARLALGGNEQLITTYNWMKPVTVAVQGVDDFEVDGAASFQVEFLASVEYESLKGVRRSVPAELLPADITCANADDDKAGIDWMNPVPVAPAVRQTSESGDDYILQFKLKSQPTANVTFTFTSSDTTEGAVEAASMILYRPGWSTSHTMKIEGVDDKTVDGAKVYTVSGATSSPDPLYNGLTYTFSLTNLDDDVSGLAVRQQGDIVLPSSPKPVDEFQSVQNVTVALDNEPAAPVTVTITSGDTSEVALQKDGEDVPEIKLIFLNTGAPAETGAVAWNTPVFVEYKGVDDLVVDKDTMTEVTFALESTDANYQFSWKMRVKNVDDDRISITPSAKSVLPKVNFTLPDFKITSQDTSFDAASLASAGGNYTSGVAAAIAKYLETLVTDLKIDPSKMVFKVQGAIAKASKTVTVPDPTNSSARRLATATVVEQTFTLSIEVQAQNAGMASSLVSVMEQTDAATVGGGIASSISGDSSALSGDATSVPAAPLAVAQEEETEIASDLPPICISPDGLFRCVSEDGTARAITVSMPDDWNMGSLKQIVYTVSVTDSTEAMVSHSVVILNTSVKSVDILVIGLDDNVVDGTKSFQLHLNGMAQDETKWHSLAPRTYVLYNLDNDVADIAVTQATVNGTTTVEYDSSVAASFTVKLLSEPCCEDSCPCSDTNDLAQQAYNEANTQDYFDALNGVSFTPSAVPFSPIPEKQGLVFVPLRSLFLKNGRTDFENVYTRSAPAVPYIAFDQNNWSTPVEVDFVGVDDFEDDYFKRTLNLECLPNSTYPAKECTDDQPSHYGVAFGPCASTADTNYDKRFVKTFDNMISMDNDNIGMNLTQLGNFTAEDRSEKSDIIIQLTSAPKATVMLTLSSSRPDKATVIPSIFAFSSVDWYIPQFAIVSGIDDDVPDGNVSFKVTASVIFTEDPDYGSDMIGLKLLDVANDFVSIGEPSCAEVPVGVKCDGPYAGEVCSPGYHSVNADGTGGCVQCGLGFYNPMYNNTGSCLPCPLGMAAKAGASKISVTIDQACQLCPEGFMAPTRGLSACVPCTNHTIGDFCAFGSAAPISLDILHRQTSVVHEWGEIEVPEFAYNGKILPWESSQDMTFQDIQLRLFLLSFLPALLVLLPITVGHYVHVFHNFMLEKPWYARFESKYFNPRTGKCRCGKKKARKKHAAQMIQKYSRGVIQRKAVLGAFGRKDLKVVPVTESPVKSKFDSKSFDKTKSAKKYNKESDQAKLLDAYLKNDITNLTKLSKEVIAREEKANRRPSVHTLGRKIKHALSNLTSKIDRFHKPKDSHMIKAVKHGNHESLEKKTFLGGWFTIAYVFAFACLSILFVGVNLKYNQMVKSALVPKDSEWASTISSDFDFAATFHGLNVPEEACPLLSQKHGGLLVHNGIQVTSEILNVTCRPGSITVAWACRKCSMEGGGALKLNLDQPLRRGSYFGLVEEALSTMGDTTQKPAYLTVPQAVMVDWSIEASPCVMKLPAGDLQGLPEVNAVRGILRYDFDGSGMSYYDPPREGDGDGDGDGGGDGAVVAENVTVPAKVLRGEEPAQVTVSATPSMFANTVHYEETDSYRLQWVADDPGIGVEEAAVLTPSTFNGVHFELILQGSNQMLTTEVVLKYTYLDLLNSVGGLAVAVSGLVFAMMRIAEMLSKGHKVTKKEHRHELKQEIAGFVETFCEFFGLEEPAWVKRWKEASQQQVDEQQGGMMSKLMGCCGSNASKAAELAETAKAKGEALSETAQKYQVDGAQIDYLKNKAQETAANAAAEKQEELQNSLQARLDEKKAELLGEEPDEEEQKEGEDADAGEEGAKAGAEEDSGGKEAGGPPVSLMKVEDEEDNEKVAERKEARRISRMASMPKHEMVEVPLPPGAQPIETQTPQNLPSPTELPSV